MRLYLIRHGQTDWNLEGKIQGRTDIPLNQAGLFQAECLAKAMSRRPVKAVYSSPLKRASQTAEALARRQSLRIVCMEELMEVDFGLWEGLTWQEIDSAYHQDFVKWNKNPADHAPTGGESRDACKSRAQAAAKRILEDLGIGKDDKDGAIVAHGAILVFVAASFLESKQDKNEIIVKNASITTIEYDRSRGIGTLIRLNEVGHLPQ